MQRSVRRLIVGASDWNQHHVEDSDDEQKNKKKL